ncbi:MAG: hypothetical protein A3F31_01265 [Candidatus Levybacteria bacterium RIFCSPHIGHO2_12_FULL_38_12]|nr:MAG: hypothetical protein A3F31_01265 [Candidatus Levybacteria bacterium RIFCSPHIGHO2_12_FULL_38_12]
MTERMVENIPQAMYTNTKEQSMSADSSVEQNQPKEKEERAEKSKARLSKNEQKNKAIKKGVDKWIDRKNGKKTPDEIKERKDKKADLKDYFEYQDIPQEDRYQELIAKMKQFQKEAKGWKLKELPIDFLVDRYLELRQTAEEAKGYEGTLRKIAEEIMYRDEKENESTNVETLYVFAHGILGGENPDGHTVQNEEDKVEKIFTSIREKHGGSENPSSEEEKRRLKEKARLYQKFHREALVLERPKFDSNGELLNSLTSDKLKHVHKTVEIMVRTSEELSATEVPGIMREIGDSGADSDEKQRFVEHLEQYLNALATYKSSEPKIGWYGQWEMNQKEKKEVENDIDVLIFDTSDGTPRQKRDSQNRIITADRIKGDELNADTIDYVFNRMFRNVDKDPKEEFGKLFGTPGQYEWQDFTTVLGGIRQRSALRGEQEREQYSSDEENPYLQKAELIDKLLKKYYMEFKLRELMHNAYFIAETGGEFKTFAGFCGQFTSEYADQVFLGSPEVATAIRIQEQVLLEIKRECNGEIPPEMVAYSPGQGESEFVRRTREKMKQLNKAGMFATANIARLPEWKIDRAMSLARGYGMVTARLPELVAECYISYPPQWWQSQKSVAWETITWELNPWDHKFKRFNIGEKALLYFTENEPRGLFRRHSKKTLQMLHSFDEITNVVNLGGDRRLIDFRNLFLSGTPITHTGWRMYVPATDKNGDLRQVLARNPGLQARVVFNRYDYGSTALERKRFLAEFDKNHPDALTEAKYEAWETYKKTLTENEQNKANQNAENIKAWKAAAKRIPHAILRLLTDKDNELLSKEQRENVIRGLFGDHPETELKKIINQTDDDLVAAKEHLLKRRHEKYLQFKLQGREDDNYFEESEDLLRDDDFDVIGMVVNNDGQLVLEEGVTQAQRQARIQRAIAVKDSVMHLLEDKELQEKIAEKIQEKGFPFSVTWEDMPMNEFHYAKAGNRGFITRKINDNMFDSQGVEEIVNLVRQIETYQSPEQIVEQLRKIFEKAQVDDATRAREVCVILGKGIVRLFEREPITKIPIAGELIDLYSSMITHEGNSYAQKIYGHSAMVWDSDDVYNFWDLMGRYLQIPPHELKKLREETGGTFWQAMGKKTKIAFYMLTAIIGYEMAQRLIGASGVLETGGGSSGGGGH